MDEKKVREAIELIRMEINTLEGIENCGRVIEARKKKHIALYNIAIEALEKQLPKKPKENEIRGGWLGKQKHYTCPTCGNCLLEEMMNERQNTGYCWDCGQRLDWTES